MPNQRTVERALLSATWEIEATHGLQYLSAFLLSDGEAVERSQSTFVLSEGISTAAANFGAEVQDGSIAHLILSGAMMLEDGMCLRGIRSLNADLAAADANPNISGIVLEVNSGGGESVAGTELQNTLLDIRRRGKTQTVVYAQTLASAALRGALAADYIVAASTTAVVGSVGTMVSLDRKAIKEIQEAQLDIYARQSTMKNLPSRALLEGDLEPLLDYVSDRAQGFIDNVEAMRPAMRRTKEQANRLQSGDLFSGTEAAEIGLIDAVGTFADAMQFLKRKKKNTYSAATVQDAAQPITTMSNTNERGGFIRLLNSIFGSAMAEDATDEQVTETLQPASETAPAEPEGAAITETNKAFTALSERVEALAETIESQAVTIAAFDDAATERAAQIADLETQLAAAKIGKPTPKSNGHATDREQFATAVNHDKKFGSKY